MTHPPPPPPPQGPPAATAGPMSLMPPLGDDELNTVRFQNDTNDSNNTHRNSYKEKFYANSLPITGQSAKSKGNGKGAATNIRNEGQPGSIPRVIKLKRSASADPPTARAEHLDTRFAPAQTR